MLYEKESYEIVGAAIEVWRRLRYGFLEKVYENALVVELGKRGFFVEQQKRFPVSYEGHVVGDYVADLVVNGMIIPEIKSAEAIKEVFLAQTLNYLKASGLRLGIILNFSQSQLEFKRMIH